MNVAIIWDIAPRSPRVNRSFGGTYHLHLHGRTTTELETSVQQVVRQRNSLHLTCQAYITGIPAGAILFILPVRPT
jgi:hypothetical protein